MALTITTKKQAIKRKPVPVFDKVFESLKKVSFPKK